MIENRESLKKMRKKEVVWKVFQKMEKDLSGKEKSFLIKRSHFFKYLLYLSVMFIQFFVVLDRVAALENRNCEEVSVLECFWKLLLENNVDIKNAICQEEIAESNLTYYWQNYIPKISVSGASTLPGLLDEDAFIPEMFYTEAYITETLPGGFEVSFAPNVTLTKGIKDLKKSVSFSNVEYIDVSKLGFSFSHGIGYGKISEWKNQEKNGIRLNKELTGVSKEMTILSIIESFTNNFIQYSQLCRNIDSTEKTIDLYEEMIEVSKVLQESKKTTMNDIFLLEENKYENEENLWNYQKSKRKVLSEMVSLLGISEDFGFQFIEKMMVQENILPERIEKIFDENPIMKYWKLQGESLETDFAMNQIASLPMLSFGVEIPLHNGNDYGELKGIIKDTSKQWTAKLSVDLTNWLSVNQRQVKYNHFLGCVNYEEQKKSAIRDLLIEYDNYREDFSNYEKQYSQAKEIYENREKIYNSMKELYEKKQCSYMDLLQSEVAFLIKKNTVENYGDSVWLYKWLLKNREM